ncbi:MAG: hypothetical protein A2103_04975 [Gammaproteobacteria bacterium GWF2_41_13]|nr:MAG: hypothetical protein A2103_04975 [Gammaproteobacteria bacterium GWF2_41_13]
MNIQQKRLLSLIEFTQQSARLKFNPVKEVNKHNRFNLFEHDSIGLPGIHFNLGGENNEVWLVIERLWKSQSPSASENLLAAWLDKSNEPCKEPTLLNAIDKKKLDDALLISNNFPIEQATLILFSEFQQREIVEYQLLDYIEKSWKPWATEEKKRRRTIDIYSELFTLKQDLEGSITDTQIELVWGMGLGIWKTNEPTISYPLIIQPVNIGLNEQDMSIEIRPRQTNAHLELDIYTATDNSGVTELEKISRDFFEKQSQVFSPFDRFSFESLLRTAVTYLDPTGIYWPNQTNAEDRQLPKATETLKVTDTWVLFARPRSKNLFIQDLENFKKQFDNAMLPLSAVVKAIVTEPLAKHETIELPCFRGICSLGNRNQAQTKASDLFFPMPYNEEQVSIIQRLECSNGVVVQGPPGTGKTHTIANIISHYMANGKRVLVTSMKEPALSVLKEKLPDTIQPLAIALLADEQDGMKQFEFAVSKIAQELQLIDRRALSLEIEQAESYTDQLHGRLSIVDRSIDDWAKRNIEFIILDGQSISPETAAKEVTQGSGHYEWLDDDALTISQKNAPKFDNTDITKLREARRNLGMDLDYLTAKLPELTAFPQGDELLCVHRELSKYSKLKATLEGNNNPSLVDTTDETFNRVDKLLKVFSDWEDIKKEIKDKNRQWGESIKQYFKKKELTQTIHFFETLAAEITIAFSERSNFLTNPVYIPSNLALTDDIVQAIANKANNKLPFGITGIVIKNILKKKLDEIRIVNSKPKTQDEWQYVYKYVLFLCRAKALILRWNNLAIELTIPTFPTEEDLNNTIKSAKEDLEVYLIIKTCQELEKIILENARLICPTWAHHQDLIENADLSREFRSLLDCHYTCHRLEKAWSKKEKLQNILTSNNGRICDSVKEFINDIVGDPSITDLQLQSQWSNLMGELRRIHSLRTYFADIKEICERISESGATKWARKLSTDPLKNVVDQLLPDNWQQAWRLCRLANHLNSASSHDEFKKLTEQRSEIEKELSRTYQETVAKRTWLKLADNATPDVKAALQAFRAAIAKIGKGTGKRAVRYRQDAKYAASKVNKTIPCWIMPHYRVSESLPAEFGCFDLVVIDEASQSDLSALPAILRASKLLIVGDDKQVSPEGVGLEEDKINNLMMRFLGDQVDIYRQEMSPERSIYDLFKVVFADAQIMLREHFRCIGPIIEYSKREFYNHELRPIRLPKTSERLDPPLIDIIIEDGFRNGKENLAEARFIVDEIKKICNDPTMKGLSIGVISLLGGEQARKIWDMLEQEIGPDLLSQHKIAYGDARSFQGKEKNIIFLSLVVSRENSKANNREASAQRFNVAASRARDRMYLVRSIEIEHLSPADTLRRNLIEHFSAPFAQDETRVKNLRDLCESGFEREVYDILTERGYKVIPQVKVGTYRIDMVVEGHQDARLAIECDGDRYHDASRWNDDMNRQRILERVGWEFWRCFASTFAMNKDSVINDLIKSLIDRGIEPIGSSGIVSSIHSEQRRLKVLTQDNIIAD